MKTIIYISKAKIFVLAFTLFSIVGFSQTKLEQGKQLKSNFEFVKAIDVFTEYFKTQTPTITDALDVAECYLMINDTKSAEVWLQKVVSQPGFKASDILLYASVLKSNGKYEDAIAQFKAIGLSNAAEKKMADAQIEACSNAMKWIKDPEYILVDNVTGVNTEYSEFGLIPFKDTYLLTSDKKISGKIYTNSELYGWTGNPYLKLFYVSSDNTGSPTTIGDQIESVNNEFHNGPAIFNEQTKTMFFTRTKMVKVTKKPVNSDPTSWYENASVGDYVNRLEIYSASYENNSWKSVKPFKYNKAQEYSVGHPALSADGKTLYFASDMPGGYGGSDIYYCELQADGQWSLPKNAGSTLNSNGKEVFPFIDSTGVLYFSSDGHPGMGGLDLFSSKGSLNNWETPENLKYPMNSPKDDFSIYYTESGKKGFLASNRDGGKGLDDIYAFTPNPPRTLILAGITKVILDDKTIVPLAGVTINLSNKTNNVTSDLSSNGIGKFTTTIDCNSSYYLTGSKDGYFTQAKTFLTECKTHNDTVFVELIFQKIVIDKPVVIENIYYDFDKWNIRPDAAVELDKIAELLIINPTVSIELGSHTDCRGNDDYNEALAQKRAESAVAYIISKGVSETRITAKGYGEKVLRNECADGVTCSEEAHQLNRRTEFKVTGVLKAKE